MSNRSAIIILDRSGSMSSQISDVVGGMEQFFVSQRESNPDLRVSLYTFNHTTQTIYLDRPISECTFTSKDFEPYGSTALLDAIGETINRYNRKRGEKVLVVILTDGHENSSQWWTKNRVRELINEKNPKNWQFLFLGVNLDSFDDAARIGISHTTTRGYGTFTAAAGAVGQSVSVQDWYMNSTANSIDLETGDKVLTEDTTSASVTP